MPLVTVTVTKSTSYVVRTDDVEKFTEQYFCEAFTPEDFFEENYDGKPEVDFEVNSGWGIPEDYFLTSKAESVERQEYLDKVCISDLNEYVHALQNIGGVPSVREE